MIIEFPLLIAEQDGRELWITGPPPDGLTVVGGTCNIKEAGIWKWTPRMEPYIAILLRFEPDWEIPKRTRILLRKSGLLGKEYKDAHPEAKGR